MTFLLDVNVLIALIDPVHVSHDQAHDWFGRIGRGSWATCPLTENGAMRIVGHPRYQNCPGSPFVVAEILAGLRTVSGHVFWADDLSLIDAEHVDRSGILTSSQVTDTYLLALARRRGGRLATFDRRMSLAAIVGGKDTLHVIGG